MTPWKQCGLCGKIVKVNKPILGDLHLCLTDEEIAYKRQAVQAAWSAQQRAMAQDKEATNE